MIPAFSRNKPRVPSRFARAVADRRVAGTVSTMTGRSRALHDSEPGTDQKPLPFVSSVKPLWSAPARRVTSRAAAAKEVKAPEKVSCVSQVLQYREKTMPPHAVPPSRENS